MSRPSYIIRAYLTLHALIYVQRSSGSRKSSYVDEGATGGRLEQSVP